MLFEARLHVEQTERKHGTKRIIYKGKLESLYNASSCAGVGNSFSCVDC